MGPVVVCREIEGGNRVDHLIIIHTRNHENAASVLYKLLSCINCIILCNLAFCCINTEDGGQGEGRAKRGPPLRVLCNTLRMNVGIRKLRGDCYVVKPVALVLLVKKCIYGIGTQ